MARGQYLAFLNSDDYFVPERIASLVEEIAGLGVLWGYSLVTGIEEGTMAAGGADIYRARQLGHLGRVSNSFALVRFNTAISTGNLFVERQFFASVGGFRNYRYNHDWDFCLRASAFAEPMVVHRPLYVYRVHAGNTIREASGAPVGDADEVFSDFIATALTDSTACTNPLSPQWPANRVTMLTHILDGGEGALVPRDKLRQLASEVRLDLASQVASSSFTATAVKRRTAVVVLGMHRSGTSAMTRVLNLCGAMLPPKLKPAKLGVNSKGFWEPEDILDLDDRILQQLGAAWDRVDFVLPTTGDLVDEFVADACSLLAAQYGDAETILIKDPRIGVLAPLWHRALLTAGYRPVYVIPVRHPLEVAQSLHARGDMSVSRGLLLWRDYTERIEAFAAGRTDVIHVRFTDLLADWRPVVRRIADRLDLRLNVHRQAADVDDFLEPSLRRQRAKSDDPDRSPEDSLGREVLALHESCLECCDRDAGTVLSFAGRADGVAARSLASATASFVVCIENNAIRDQALLLCESIRRFGGRHRDAQILAFSPRPGRAVDAATRSALLDLNVEYVDEPLNTFCHDYAPANKSVAGAWAEAHCSSDFVVVLDSDTVWLAEPQLPDTADVAVRPVDSKGSATSGPGDRFEPYWQALADMSPMALDRVPYLTTTIGLERIRASYDGGLLVARRDKGLLGRWAELFRRSVEAGLLPYRGTGLNIVASTGQVGRAGSEYWGSIQATFTVAVWAVTDRVMLYPPSYNLPLQLVATQSDVDAAWYAEPPVHLHYHGMFQQDHCDVAIELMAKLGVPEDRLAWLARRTPI